MTRHVLWFVVLAGVAAATAASALPMTASSPATLVPNLRVSAPVLHNSELPLVTRTAINTGAGATATQQTGVKCLFCGSLTGGFTGGVGWQRH